MNQEQARASYERVSRLASGRGYEMVPCKDVIDLAQDLKLLMEQFYGKDYLAGNQQIIVVAGAIQKNERWQNP